MQMSVLEKIGLTHDQVKTYTFLLQAGALSPKELMALSGETRTNAYMSLAKLEVIGLATRDEQAKKLTYIPASPAKLEQLLARRQEELQATQAALQSALPELLTEYYTHSRKPGIRFYEGADSLARIYQDHLDTNQDVYFVRTPADEQFFGEELYDYMERRAKQGITAHGIAPYTKAREAFAKANDKKLRRKMTWCSPRQYRAPVEISIYGTKTAFISFGEEVVASIIDSPQIASAMKELFAMAQGGAAV
jgi:sugar-specific transcriptional regulator TrmB